MQCRVGITSLASARKSNLDYHARHWDHVGIHVMLQRDIWFNPAQQPEKSPVLRDPEAPKSQQLNPNPGSMSLVQG